jgi:hypothetical protein
VLRALLGALVGLAVGSAIVLAHGGNPGRIHGCVADDTGTPDPTARLRIVGPNDCPLPNGVDWNIATGEGDPGPRGPAGATGSQGQTGPAGRAGASSEIRLRVVVAAAPWSGPGTQAVEALCRRDEFAVAGGWRAEDPSGIGTFKATENRALDDGTGWRVRADGWYTYKRWRLVVHASCAPRRAAR